MIKTFHGLSTLYGNIMTDIRIAHDVGFEAYEITENKLLRYINSNLDLDDLNRAFKNFSVKPVCINAIKSIEVVESTKRKEILKEAETLILAAEKIKCPTIQLVAFTGLEELSWKEILNITAYNVSEIVSFGKKHGIRFQWEPIAWAPINSLEKSLELIEIVNKDNFGMVIDFWHLWAGGGTTPEDVANLDKNMIYGVHFCDGIRKKKFDISDETEMRAFLPGEGDINIKEWVNAVKKTGFDGVWSSELLGEKYWEGDLLEVARETKRRMEMYI